MTTLNEKAVNMGVTLEFIQAEIEGCEASISSWSEAFLKNPAYELSAAQRIYARAAQLKVLQEVQRDFVQYLASLKSKGRDNDNAIADFQTLKSEWTDRVLRAASYPVISTISSEVIMARHELQALARALEKYFGVNP